MKISTEKEYSIEEDIVGFSIVGMIPRPKNIIEFHLKKDETDKAHCVCKKCGKDSNTRVFRKRARTIHAVPQEGFRILLKIEVADYECKNCNNEMFGCPIIEKGKGEIPHRGRYTLSFLDWIKDLHKKEKMSCSAIAKKTGLSTTTVCELVK